MSTQPIIQNAVSEFEKAFIHLKDEFARLQVGQANPAIVDSILVESYGSNQPIRNIATISAPDPRTLSIQPWDRSMLGPIECAIQTSDLNLNPVNNGASIILNIPQLTEERRRDLVKVVHQLAEDARISIRNSRQTAHSKFKKMAQDKQINEDESKGAEKQLQEKVDQYNEKIADLAKSKEDSMMKL